ncbi:MAG: peptide deformylase [Dehalococcoidia bacterium]|jgi:peptide deformylase
MIVTDIDYLRKPCQEVTERINLEAMAAALKHELKVGPGFHSIDSLGIGLTANQIHIPYRVCLIAVGKMNPIILVNPEIIKERDYKESDEGCLSLPGISVRVSRPTFLKVRAMDENRHRVKYTFRGLDAACVCHEVDHLNGVLIIDHLSAEKKAEAEEYFRRLHDHGES